MSTEIRLNTGTGTSIDPQQDAGKATSLPTGETAAKRMDNVAHNDAAMQTIQKVLASIGLLISGTARANDDASSSASSLPDLPPPTGGLDLNSLMKALAFETRKQACREGVNSLENRSKDQERIGKEQLDELAKQIAAMEKKDFWGGILKVFQWIGAVIGIIASAASVAGGVLSGNPALITAGVIGCVMAVESTISLASDGKISLLNGITELFKACGMDEEAANIAAMVVQALITVASIAVSIGAAVKGASAKAAQISDQMLQKIFYITMQGQRVLNFASAGLAAGQGALGIANSVFQNDADKSKANSKELEALMEQVRMSFESEQLLLKNEMERAAALMEKTTEMVKDCNRTQSKIVSTAPAMA